MFEKECSNFRILVQDKEIVLQFIVFVSNFSKSACNLLLFELKLFVPVKAKC